jgi:hypothetical protein
MRQGFPLEWDQTGFPSGMKSGRDFYWNMIRQGFLLNRNRQGFCCNKVRHVSAEFPSGMESGRDFYTGI